MIGVALVAFVTVFAAGLKSTVAQVVDENFAGGLVIQNTDGFSPIPNATARERPSRCPGSSWWRRSAAPKRSCSKAGRPGATTKVDAPSPDIGETVNIEWKKGGPSHAPQASATARRSSPTTSPTPTASSSATASGC